MVPTMIHSLLQVGNIDEFDLSSLSLFIYSAAPMPVELLKLPSVFFRAVCAALRSDRRRPLPLS